MTPDFGPASSGWFPTYSQILGTVAMIIALGSAASAYINGVKERAKTEVGFAESAKKTAETEKALAVVSRELTEHKLEVATRYVNADTLRQVEARLFSAIDGVTTAIRDLGARLDRAFEQRQHD
jgi:hypothetical protein